MSNFKELYTKISHELTELEECVFKLRMQGFSYKEIADILDKEEKSIDNAIQRIKVKIKSLMINLFLALYNSLYLRG